MQDLATRDGQERGSIDDYIYLDGEFVAAWLLGYNFGCGYLHGRYALGAVQEMVGFERGEH